MAKRNEWTREQLLVAFRLYCRTPFGKLHRRNPDIIALAQAIGRTPSAVAMKACNFASLDPAQRARRIAGLKNRGEAAEILWQEFGSDSEAVAAEAEAAYERITASSPPAIDEVDEFEIPEGPTEVARIVRVRRVQGFFRAAVLNSYEHRCALTDLAVPALLNASHIIPWNAPAEAGHSRRADPRNGLCLNVLHDRAFDRGLITFDEDWRAVISPRLRIGDSTFDTHSLHQQALLDIEGHQLRLPDRFQPDSEAISWHRERIFKASA